MTIQDLQWKNRVVLYFPEKRDDSLTFSDSVLQDIEERKIAYFIFGDSVASNIEISFSPTYLQQTENKYRMGYKGDMFVLIGLDGGVKLKKEDTLDWDLIFGAIDAMPMRQSEKRKGAL